MKFPWIKTKFGADRYDPRDLTRQPVDPLVAIPTSVIGGRLEDLRLASGKNRYAVADNLYSTDERLYSSVELMAIMIEKSFGDSLGNIVSIRNDDANLSNEEENAVNEANKFARNLDGVGVPRLAYHYTIDLWKYGDAVDVIKSDGSGITGLQPLPMSAVTAVDKKEQIGKVSFNQFVISNPQFYVIDEMNNSTDLNHFVYRKDRIFHISFNPRRNMIRDNLNRWTFNVWSTAPINSLIGIIAWKQNLIRNDMLWSNRNLPREIHTLDLSMYDISRFSGSFEAREAASKAAAERAIRSYSEKISRKEADQGYVMGKGVSIGYLEPKTSNWKDPSGIIDQINSLIAGPTGAPGAVLAGESKGFTSLVHSASFMALRAEIYAGVIQRKMESLIKQHVRLARPGIRDEVIDRLYIKNRLILDRDRTELAKIIAVLVGSNAFTPDEIRAIWGLDPMTEDQANKIIQWIKDTRQSSGLSAKAEDVVRQKPDAPTGDQESYGKRSRDLLQTGDMD